ncbi:SDR family NAD(P)-dependent oxidoreductase [Mycobacterium sp. pUA109]|uniref:SDR family NAD(P)-dependent oxidoreductase n=1 Tax=Mycobacterium sp. pUA109 TaxID=3238982 RepID=UPI00351B16DA
MPQSRSLVPAPAGAVAGPAHGGRAVVITDASSPIGLASAAQVAQRGDLVLMGSRYGDACERLAAGLRARGAAAFAAALDLADAGSIDRFVDSAHYLVGEIDVVVADVTPLVSAAGPYTVGAQHLAAQLVPPMIERGSGDVVLVSPEPLARTGQRHLEAWLSGLDAEFVGSGVRVSLVRSAPAGGCLAPHDVGRVVAALLEPSAPSHLRVVEVIPRMC